MAQPIPCAVCGEQPDADWMVTARTEATGWEPGTTVGLCVNCWIGLAFAKAEEIMGDQPAGPETPPEEPGVLEQVEADEGEQPVARRNGRARKSEPEPEPEPGPQPEAEPEAADVDG